MGKKGKKGFSPRLEAQRTFEQKKEIDPSEGSPGQLDETLRQKILHAIQNFQGKVIKQAAGIPQLHIIHDAGTTGRAQSHHIPSLQQMVETLGITDEMIAPKEDGLKPTGFA